MYMLYMNKYTFITSFAQFNLFIIFTLQENDNHHCNGLCIKQIKSIAIQLKAICDLLVCDIF